MMDRSKRQALATLAKLAALAGSAALFGSAISKAAASDRDIVLFYSSKYGATLDTAQWIAKAVDRPVKVVSIAEADRVAEVFNTSAQYVLGSAVFKEQPMLVMQAFVEEYKSILDGRTLASFVVCGTQADSDKNKQRIAGYLEKLTLPLLHRPELNQHFGGRLVVANLTEEDHQLLERFYTKVLKKPLVDWDRTDREAVIQWAQAKLGFRD